MKSLILFSKQNSFSLSFIQNYPQKHINFFCLVFWIFPLFFTIISSDIFLLWMKKKTFYAKFSLQTNIHSFASNPLFVCRFLLLFLFVSIQECVCFPFAERPNIRTATKTTKTKSGWLLFYVAKEFSTSAEHSWIIYFTVWIIKRHIFTIIRSFSLYLSLSICQRWRTFAEIY